VAVERSCPRWRRSCVLADEKCTGADCRGRGIPTPACRKCSQTSKSCSSYSTPTALNTSLWGLRTGISWRPPIHGRPRSVRQARTNQCSVHSGGPRGLRLRLAEPDGGGFYIARYGRTARRASGPSGSHDFPLGSDLGDGCGGQGLREVWRVNVCYIGREQLLANKRALGRVKDRADLEALGESDCCP
jgi:hypothetical protein